MTVKKSLPVIFVLIAAMMITLSAFSGKNTELNEETLQIKEAASGAMECIAANGLYQSSDGTTGSLSEEELQTQINRYNAAVDQYYSKSNGCNETYKLNNDYLLREAYYNKVYNCRESGISDFTIDEINYNSEEEVELKGVCSMWNKWIIKGDASDQYGDDRYHVEYSQGEVIVDLLMTREDGSWKLKQTLQFQPVEQELEQGLTDEIKDYISDHITSSEQTDIELNNERITEKGYDDFDSALEALESLR